MPLSRYHTRATLALDLVSAHEEDAVHARQEAALNAAKVRRVSRDLAGQGQGSIGSSMDCERVAGGRPPTASTNRCGEEEMGTLTSGVMVERWMVSYGHLWRRGVAFVDGCVHCLFAPIR